MSEMSFGSSKSHDMAHAWELWGGPLVEVAPGREPRPKPKLVALFRGIAAYMVSRAIAAPGMFERNANAAIGYSVGACA